MDLCDWSALWISRIHYFTPTYILSYLMSLCLAMLYSISYFYPMSMSCTQSSSSEEGTQELCHKYHKYLAPFCAHYSTSQLMRQLAALLLTKWSVLQHRQLHRREICLSIIYGKRCLLCDFIPKHSAQFADLESLINLQGGLNTFYSSKSNNPL